jgi:hypothetical protein
MQEQNIDAQALKALYEQGYWKTREGSILHCAHMSDAHLLNVDALLRKWAIAALKAQAKIMSFMHDAIDIRDLQAEDIEAQINFAAALVALTDDEELIEGFKASHPFNAPLQHELKKRGLIDAIE